MRCEACGRDNRAGARFCAGCGDAFAAGCPVCGGQLGPDDRFCAGCGASRASRASTPAPAGDALRRRATVVFCDLSGYTALNEALDPEEVEPIMIRIKTDAIRIVEELGGLVNQFVGDEVMALFGIPVAHGDDAHRAVLAALRLHESIGPLAVEVQARTGMTLALHTAVHTGLLLGRRRDDREGRYTITGDAVNTCARLLKLARPDDILVSEQTRRLVASRFVTESLPPALVKGKALPLTPFRIVGERPPDPHAARHTFVGRDREVGQLAEALRETGSSGRGRTAHVVGEAGIGKSALVAALRARAEEATFACHAAQALDFGVGLGRDPVSVLVASLLGLDAAAATELERRAAVEASLVTGLVPAAQRFFVEELLALPPSAERRAVTEAMDAETRRRGRWFALAELVRRRTEEGPQLVVVEDLHWADEQTLDVVAGLAALCASLPLLLVTTARADEDPLPARRLTPNVTISLGPLPPEDARALAQGLGIAGSDVVEHCVERASGHPLFLEQLLRSAEVDGEQVPGTVESTVLARIDKLPAAEREALQAAAVLGQRFPPSALRWLLQPDGAGGDDGPDLTGLRARSLLAGDGTELAFTHALVQEAIYGSLLRARRRALHERAAAWYAGRDPALRAEHLERAEDPAAPQAYLDAATARLAELDLPGAARLAERGVELVASAPLRFELLCLQGRVRHDLGQGAASCESFRAALGVAARDDQRCRAWLGLAGALRLADESDEALAALERAERTAIASGLEPERAAIHHLRGNVLFPLGDLAGCLREHGRALQLARQVGSVELEAAAEGGLGDAQYLCGDMAAAQQHFLRCVELSRAHGLGRIEVAHWPMLGWSRAYLGDLDAALADGLAAADLARRLHHERAELVAQTVAGWVALELDDLAQAERAVRRVAELAAALASPRFLVQSLVWSAYLARAQGDPARARALVQQAAATRRAPDRSYNGAFTLGALAWLADDAGAREAALEEGEALLAEGCVIHNHLWFLRDAIETALEQRDWDRADAFATRLLACTPVSLPWSELVAARAHALSAAGRSGPEAPAIAALRDVRARLEGSRFLRYLPAIDRALGV